MTDTPAGASPPLNRGRAADLIGRSPLSAHQKLILLAYMSHLPSERPPDAGVAWPGLETLSAWASCSRSTAQAARAELLAAGILVAVERGDTSMKCRLDFDRLAGWEPPARDSRRGGAGNRQGADVRQGAGNRQGGVPVFGIGGADVRQGGVPVFGTEPSSDNPPHQPSSDNAPKLMAGPACAEPPAAGAAQLSLLGAEPEPVTTKPTKPTKASREVEAAAVLFARLERLRLERYQRLGRTVRGLSAEAWVPKLRKALAKTTAGDIEDGWVWLLRHPDAAWHRGEDRGGSDRCTDFAMLLARPEQYGPRRTWTGLTGLTTIEQEEVAAWLASGGRSADAPAWRERMRAAGVQVPNSEEEDDELWNGIGSAGSSASTSPAADEDDGYVCPF